MRVLSCIISCLLLGTTATAWAAGTQDALPPLSEARDDLRIVRISLADLQGQPADVRAWIDEHLDPCAIDRDPDGIRRAVLFLTPDELAALQARGAPVEDVGRLADHIAAFAPWNTLAKKRVPSIEAVVGRIMPETEGPDDDGAPRGVECQNIGTSLMPYDEYHNIEESVCFLQNLAAAYPNICRLVSLGQSIQGRDIWALKITDQPDAVEPGEEKIFIKATTHAREWATHETLLYIAEYLTSRYATDARVQRIVDRSVVWLVPITNPDGYAHTWNGPQPSARMWRKNRKLNNVQNCNNNPNSTCCGVDINRNYSYVWGNFGGSSGNACSETYRGGSAASEPETQAIQNFIAAEKPAIAVSFHSYSQLWLYPWGNTGSVTPESYSSLRAMGKKLSQLVNDVHGLFYIPGQSNYNIYATNGDFNDFAYGAHGVLSFTPEVRPTNTGLGGFLLPEDQILECAEENTAAMLWLMDNVAGTIDVRSSADGSLFETVAADETLEFALPGPPAHQRPTDSLGYPAGFPNTLLTRLDDNVHNPPSWGDFPADFEGCGTGSGYTLETRDQPALATWINSVESYRALPYIFEEGAEIMLSNRLAGLNLIGIPSSAPVALADISIIKRRLVDAPQAYNWGTVEEILEERTALEDLANPSPWIDWAWQHIRPDETVEISHPTGAGGADTHVHPFRAYRVQVNVPSYQFGGTDVEDAVFLLRFPGSSLDCNRNDVFDLIEIAGQTAQDCNLDGVPDDCQTDCNANGFEDSCDPVLSDVEYFVAQLLDEVQEPAHFCLLDSNSDATLDGHDLQPFVDRILGF